MVIQSLLIFYKLDMPDVEIEEKSLHVIICLYNGEHNLFLLLDLISCQRTRRTLVIVHAKNLKTTCWIHIWLYSICIHAGLPWCCLLFRWQSFHGKEKDEHSSSSCYGCKYGERYLIALTPMSKLPYKSMTCQPESLVNRLWHHIS